MDFFAEKLLQAWLLVSQMEQLDPMLSELSSLKTLFKQSIVEYERLNMAWLSEIITVILDPQHHYATAEA